MAAKERRTTNFLIRNMPAELYELLDRSAQSHRRSKNQEAILALSQGLSSPGHTVEKPKPAKWPGRLSAQAIRKAKGEGRA
jgi:hypothetical protein